MYREKFVLSVMHNGSPIKETGSRNNRRASIPFGSEYKLRLKNKNDRSCTVNLSIDGSPVSNFGDFIVNAGGTLDLERFVTNSMNRGKKFKFVTLDHRDVDDPTRSTNGIIRAEFRLAKQPNGIKMMPPTDWVFIPPNWDHGSDTGDVQPGADWSYTYNNSTGGGRNHRGRKHKGSPTWSSSSSSVHYCSSDSIVGSCAAPVSFTESGATVEGSRSNQNFTHSHLEVEDKSVILELKMMGIKQDRIRSRTTSGRFCTQCGGRVRQCDKYCAGCGRRI